MVTAREQLANAMTEAQLEAAVEAQLTAYGWRWHHETDSRRSRAGLPDLVCCNRRQRRIMFIELKSQRGRLRPEQRAWLDDAAAAGAEVRVWRPSDHLNGTIRRDLSGITP